MTCYERWVALLMMAIAHVASAQNSTSITPIVVIGAMPQCAQPCMISGIEAASCSTTDIRSFANCICLDELLQSEFNDCVQIGCDSMTDWGTALSIEGQLCEAYPKPDRSRVPIIAAIVSIAIVLPCVAARLTSRLKYTGKLWPDDWAMIFTLVVFLGLAAILIVSAHLGLGIHFWHMKVENAIPLMQIFYASQVMYIVVTFSGKFAILLLYQRVFDTGSNRWFGKAVKVCLVLQGIDTIIYLGLIIFECVPIAAVWDKSITNAKCLNLRAVALIGSISSIATDVILIILPMPVLWRLQVSRTKRIGLALIFSVASLGTVASVVRLFYLGKLSGTTDRTWTNVDVTIWSLIEILCTIVCGSVPAMRPLLARAVPTVKLSVSWDRGSTARHQCPKASKASTGVSSSNHAGSRSYDQKSDVWLSMLTPISTQTQQKEPEHIGAAPRHAESQDRLYHEYDV